MAIFGEEKLSSDEILMEITFAERCLVRRGDETGIPLIEAMVVELHRRLGAEAAWELIDNAFRGSPGRAARCRFYAPCSC